MLTASRCCELRRGGPRYETSKRRFETQVIVGPQHYDGAGGATGLLLAFAFSPPANLSSLATTATTAHSARWDVVGHGLVPLYLNKVITILALAFHASVDAQIGKILSLHSGCTRHHVLKAIVNIYCEPISPLQV